MGDYGDARTALVIGGSRGIGRAVVQRLAGDGAAVLFSYVTDRSAADDVLRATAESPGTVLAERADLRDLGSVRALFARAEQEMGGLDVLVNNAAIGVLAPMADATEEQYDLVMDTNAKGTFFAIQEAARRLRDGGRIINVSTINTTIATPGNALYSASKAAIEQYTAIAAQELGPRGITVNTVSPGPTDTDLLRSVTPPEALPRLAAMSPLGRLGAPTDVAAVVAFLAGEDGGWVTGQNLRASGGIG
jgi:3-oxoacyl-[acyl-carrier protein] reductase